MNSSADTPIVLGESRFSRLESVEWWDQSRLRDARILVIGAGALGNEIIKNLALLGVGHVVVADMDLIEESNLCRSVLFRDSDEGLPKAECAARAANDIYRETRITPLVANVLADVGMGYFKWADVVVGAVDNREARVFVNSTCAQLRKAWVDGGIEVLSGVARVFAPPEGACYECTMGQVDWDVLNKRRSCSLLARRALDHGGTPTTSTTASIIGAVQAQEVVKLLHDKNAMVGRGFVFDGLNNTSYTVEYPTSRNCPWHEAPSPVESLEWLNSGTTLQDAWNWAEDHFGGLDAIDLSRELVHALTCEACEKSTDVFAPVDRITESEVPCPICGAERTPAFLHTIGVASGLHQKTLHDLGLPRWDILWARKGERVVGMEMAGDNTFAMK